MSTVTNYEIKLAVWHNQLKKTADGALVNYHGGHKRVARPDHQHYGQDHHIIERHTLDIPLSKGHLRKRLVALIDAGGLSWVVPNCTFVIKSAKADQAWQYAREWWLALGVPVEQLSGERLPAVQIDDYETKLTKLQGELLARFGGGLA